MLDEHFFPHYHDVSIYEKNSLQILYFTFYSSFILI